MATTLWIGTSWKMTKTLAEARAFARALADAEFPAGVQPFVLPAHTSLSTVRETLPRQSPVLLGAQNAHWAQEGAGTGEISMRMAADAGAVLVELGHSERREGFGETDETVALKARAALDAGLTPLICVGESSSVRAKGMAEEYVAAQVRAALSRVQREELPRILLAYEPIWAIGESGRPATPSEVSPVMSAIRAAVACEDGNPECRAVMYGGSVALDNAAVLLRETGADGLFVGRAAWQVPGFLALVRTVGEFAALR